MKVMLTSFGIEQTYAPERGRSLFDKMPPVSFRLFNEAFMPDYELLILCDQVVMDEASFQRLIDRPARAYSWVAETFRALKSEGRIELVNFSSVLHANSDLLEAMLKHDMSVLEQWVVPLRELLMMWRHFAAMSVQVSRDREQSDELGTTHTRDLQYRSAIMHEVSHFVVHAAEIHAADESPPLLRWLR